MFIFLTVYIIVYFDDAKELVNRLLSNLENEKENLKFSMNNMIQDELTPIFNKANLIYNNSAAIEIQSKIRFIKSHYNDFLIDTNKLGHRLSNQTATAIHTYYNMVAQIEKLAIQNKVMSRSNLKATDKFLHLLGYANIIEDLETWPILLYFSCAIFCLGSSTIFHWFNPKNRTVFKILNRIDLASISFMIWGSTTSVLFYCFYCDKFWFYFYFVLLIVSCSSVFVVSMFNFLYQNSYRKFRGNMYVILGLFSSVSVIQSAMMSYKNVGPGSDVFPFEEVIWYMVAMGATYIIGAQFYVLRIPERWSKGTFDIWLNSHTIWHMFVFAASIIHFFGLRKAYDVRATINCLA